MYELFPLDLITYAVPVKRLKIHGFKDFHFPGFTWILENRKIPDLGLLDVWLATFVLSLLTMLETEKVVMFDRI